MIRSEEVIKIFPHTIEPLFESAPQGTSATPLSRIDLQCLVGMAPERRTSAAGGVLPGRIDTVLSEPLEGNSLQRGSRK